MDYIGRGGRPREGRAALGCCHVRQRTCRTARCRTRRRVGADAEVRRRRARHLRRDRRPFGRGVDGRTHECAGAGQDHRQRRGLVLQPLARRLVEEGRDVGPHPARRRDARRLRPGRRVDQGRADGRRLSHRPPLLLLPRRAARPARPSAAKLEFREERVFDPKSCIGVSQALAARVSPSPAPPFATAAARGRGGGGRPSRRAGRRRRRRDWPRTHQRSPAPVRAPAASA